MLLNLPAALAPRSKRTPTAYVSERPALPWLLGGAGLKNGRNSLANLSSTLGCRHSASIFSFHMLPSTEVLILQHPGLRPTTVCLTQPCCLRRVRRGHKAKGWRHWIWQRQEHPMPKPPPRPGLIENSSNACSV